MFASLAGHSFPFQLNLTVRVPHTNSQTLAAWTQDLTASSTGAIAAGCVALAAAARIN